MTFWLITIGEPVPSKIDGDNRLLRTGYLAQYMAKHGHEVIWWTSTFDHFNKIHYFNHDKTIQLNENYRIEYLYGGGYNSNISLSRIFDHRKIAFKLFKKVASQPKPDLILCSFPPIELSLSAVKYAKLNNVPVVLDMRDMWPDIFLEYIPAPLRNLALILIDYLIKERNKACASADAITGITEAFVDYGIKAGQRVRSIYDRAFPLGYDSIPPKKEKILIAENYWDELGIKRRPDQFIACFFGTLGRQLDLNTIVEAADQLKKFNNKFNFVLCGTGDRIKYLKKKANCTTNILFPGWVDAAKIYVLMRRSSVGLDPMPDRYDFLATINNKAIEYLSAGLPIISSPSKGELHNLLKNHNCGVSYPPNDPDTLKEILLKMANDRINMNEMSENASRLFLKMFVAGNVYHDMMDYLIKIGTFFGNQRSGTK